MPFTFFSQNIINFGPKLHGIVGIERIEWNNGAWFISIHLWWTMAYRSYQYTSDGLGHIALRANIIFGRILDNTDLTVDTNHSFV